MAWTSKRRLAATLVVTLGVADGVGIYLAHNKLDKSPEIGPRELAVANEPLTEPIAIRTSGELKPAPALAQSVVAPQAAPTQAAPAKVAPQTARLAAAEPVKAPAAAARAPAPVAAPARERLARQTVPVVIGRMAEAEKPAARRSESRRSAMANVASRHEDLRVHQQRIPARMPRAERIPAREDAFAAVFGASDEALRLPEPAYGRPDPLPRGQASAELPPLELSTSQIHSDPAGPGDDMPSPPPATAAGAEDALPKS